VSDGTSADRVLKTGEAVAERLRRRVATGDLVSGDRLPPEDELMEQFGVARTTLREGLRILESQGLIAIRRGRNGGPRVTTPPVERVAQGFALHLQLEHVTIGDLDDARQLIEPMLAARLARQHSKADIAALRNAVEFAEHATTTGDLKQFGKAAALMHTTIAERGGNRTLALVSAMLHELVEKYYEDAASRASDAETDRALRSYRKLVRLVEAGDADGAADHWRRHMAFTIDRSDRNRALDLF
jgi:DNA-binding FadR family transcriptional regulator